MEVKNNKGQIILLDACTLINILYINENECITKLLKKLNFFIAEKVYEETKKNLFARFTLIQKDDEDFKNKLQTHLLNLSSNIITNNKIQDLTDSNFINDALKVFNYRNRNGEFFSSAYSLFLSRVYDTKVVFFTDDYPARQHFSKYFEFQKIGYVEDIVDLLVFLSTMSNSFTTRALINYFTSILSSYNSQIVSLRKELEKFRNNLTFQQKKDSFLRNNLTSLLKKLSNFELDGIKNYQNKFDSRKYPALASIIKNYTSVFEINSESREAMINKVNNIKRLLEEQKLYKFN